MAIERTPTQTQADRALGAVLDARRQRRLNEVAEWQAIVDFAEHYSTGDHPELPAVLRENFLRLGGEGTPRVSEFAALELGAALKVSTMSASSQMACALDLKHRLPHCWQLFCNGHLEPWVARELASQTRDLSGSAVGWLDERFARQASFLPAGRQARLIAALVIDADPDAALAKEQARWEHRYVAVDPVANGAVNLHGRLDVLDAHQFDAMTDRLADVLADRGADQGKQELRAKAVGILANPVRALTLLQQAAQPTLDEADIDPHLLAGRAWAAPAIAEGDSNVPNAIDEDPIEPDVRYDLPERVELDVPRHHAHPPAWFRADDARRSLDQTEIEALTTSSVRTGAGSCSEWCGRLDPDDVKLLPKATLTVHISYETFVNGNGVARVEDFGPMTWQGLAEQLGAGAHVTVKPVVDLDQLAGVDRYEVPHRLRDAVIQRDLYEAFPGSSRRSQRLDLDHTRAWSPPDSASRERGAPPQTRPENLAPLTRRVHRAKTAGHWRADAMGGGVLRWRSPAGREYLVAPNGHVPLSDAPPDAGPAPGAHGRPPICAPAS